MKILINIAALLVLNACTLSFQNVDTHGTATDLIDETQEASPETDLQVKVPPCRPPSRC